MATFSATITRSTEVFEQATITVKADTLEEAQDKIFAMLDDYSEEVVNADWHRTHDETSMLSPYVEDIWREDE